LRGSGRDSRGSDRGSDLGSGRGSDLRSGRDSGCGSGRVSGEDSGLTTGGSLRGSGLFRGAFSIACWPRVRFSTPSGRVGRTIRPGRSSDRGWSAGRSSLFLRPPCGSGRLTAPVDGVSPAGVDPLFVCDGPLGSSRRGSRPRKTRDRLRSSSKVTPGARLPAPVRRSGMSMSGKRRPERVEPASVSPPREGLIPSNSRRRGRL